MAEARATASAMGESKHELVHLSRFVKRKGWAKRVRKCVSSFTFVNPSLRRS